MTLNIYNHQRKVVICYQKSDETHLAAGIGLGDIALN
jgi:hypothetical protein